MTQSSNLSGSPAAGQNNLVMQRQQQMMLSTPQLGRQPQGNVHFYAQPPS